MKESEQTIQQVERFIRKIAQKFPASEDVSALTDIHIMALQDGGELKAFDDDDNEITRCIVEQWIDYQEEDFDKSVTEILQRTLSKMREVVDNLGILKPYSFVLEDEEKQHLAELYVADDDTVIIDGDLMADLDQDLDAFLDNLLKEK